MLLIFINLTSETMINSALPGREYHSQEDKILPVNQSLTPFFCLANYIFINIILKLLQ